MSEVIFAYVAVNAAGRRTRGTIEAPNETSAFAALRQQGLAPVTLRRSATAHNPSTKAQGLPDGEAAALLENLAQLLSAGADIRTALAILRQKQERAGTVAVCNRLQNQISGGVSLEAAFTTCFEGSQAFVSPMIAAAETSGDLPQGLRRAATVLQARLRLRGQLISALAYPSFVAVSALITVLVILLFVVPAIEPMAEDAGAQPPFALRELILASDLLRGHWRALLSLWGVVVAGLVAAQRLGLLRKLSDRLLLDGPMRKIGAALIYGRYSASLGSMLAGGAAVTDALRLGARCVGSDLARSRLEEVARAVRQGELLSAALERVPGFPGAVIRLAWVGEASDSLGEMLKRGGELEEQAALARLEAGARMAGPVIVILLGLLLGTLMAGLLSGVAGLGQTALR